MNDVEWARRALEAMLVRIARSIASDCECMANRLRMRPQPAALSAMSAGQIACTVSSLGFEVCPLRSFTSVVNGTPDRFASPSSWARFIGANLARTSSGLGMIVFMGRDCTAIGTPYATGFGTNTEYRPWMATRPVPTLWEALCRLVNLPTDSSIDTGWRQQRNGRADPLDRHRRREDEGVATRGRAQYAALILAAAAVASNGAERSRELRAAFMREHPCPSTGRTVGPCPGWQVDHAVPLCLGGQAVDAPKNLRWITVEDHKAKTRDDVRLCRRVKREVVTP